jgi:hypothetical protein
MRVGLWAWNKIVLVSSTLPSLSHTADFATQNPPRRPPPRFTVYLSTEPPLAIMDAIKRLTPLESAAQLKSQSRARHDSILAFDGL